MNNLPNDPMMLLSVINMKLRDFYSDLDALCDDMDVSRDEITAKLATIDCAYDATSNRFI